MIQQTLELLIQGAKAHQADRYRKGNTIFLPDGASAVVSGDLHGNRRNFDRIVSFANLDSNSDNHLVLQEIIHGGPEDDDGGCLSYELLFDAVKLKIKYPDRVHILMGNHDTAFISHNEVMKNGKEMNQSMRAALQRSFGDGYEQIDLEIARLLFAQPLAVKCPNRIMVSHSLPADRSIEMFDPTILDRTLKINDIVRPQSAYLLTWGRHQSAEAVEKLADIFGVDTFILGHQPQTEGFCKVGDKMLIIASDHNHGVVVKFDVSAKLTIDDLVKSIVPLASIL